MRNVPEQALTCGFVNEPVGSHTSRTIMISELRSLLGACLNDSTYQTYYDAVVNENVLGKGTRVTRVASLRQLRELYALDPDVRIFRALRDLWDADAEAQPVLALLCATARDPLLRASASGIVVAAVGDTVDAGQFADIIEREYPGRYKESGRGVTGRNLIGSWRHAGYVSPAPSRKRRRVEPRVTSVAYALLLGYLCGARGEMLFETFWTGLLDSPTHRIRELAAGAGRQGWLEYRQAGGVTEISFRQLLRSEGALP